MLMEIGRLCLKIAGRDANRRCVIIEVIDARTVLIDGQTRRRRCNIAHLEPLDQVLELPKGALHTQVRAAFEKLGLAVLDSKARPATERPRKASRQKAEPPGPKGEAKEGKSIEEEVKGRRKEAKHKAPSKLPKSVE